MQHFVILPIKTKQDFYIGNVHILVLYTFCVPFLLLIGECRLVELSFFDLKDIHNDIQLHLDKCGCARECEHAE